MALPPEVLVQILKGAADKASEAGIAIVGGHTIKSEEPIFGLAVVGKIAPDQVLSNDKAQPGNVRREARGSQQTRAAIVLGARHTDLTSRNIAQLRQL